MSGSSGADHEIGLVENVCHRSLAAVRPASYFTGGDVSNPAGGYNTERH